MEKQGTPQIPRDGKFNITFTGNIGTAQGLEVLPKTAGLIKDWNMDKYIRFNIVGDGRYKDKFIKLIDSMNLLYMFNFVSHQHPTKISKLLAASDIAFLCLKNEPLFKMTVPAKLQSYMACGMPILASVTGETRRIIEEAGCGLCSPPGDEESLYNNILKFLNMTNKELDALSTNAKKYCDDNFNKDELLNIMDQYLDSRQKVRGN